MGVFLFPIIGTDSVYHADSGDFFFGTILIYKKFDPIPWEFGFENFAQNLKLRGLRPYAWAFYSQSRRKYLTFYPGHFHA